MNKKIHTIELFAGCGGLLDGFLQQGKYDTLACVEWEQYPCQTLEKRLLKKWHHKNAHNEVVRFDIQRTDELINGFDDSEYEKYEGLDKLIGGKKVMLQKQLQDRLSTVFLSRLSAQHWDTS